tara:strand:+ start:9816 stop:10097 length:282 start_codon:yes stop_codon:yes gene_type:complete
MVKRIVGVIPEDWVSNTDFSSEDEDEEWMPTLLNTDLVEEVDEIIEQVVELQDTQETNYKELKTELIKLKKMFMMLVEAISAGGGVCQAHAQS